MKTDEIFELYGRVLKGDKDAKEEFVELYKKEWPKNFGVHDHHFKINQKAALHQMYLHLVR